MNKVKHFVWDLEGRSKIAAIFFLCWKYQWGHWAPLQLKHIVTALLAHWWLEQLLAQGPSSSCGVPCSFPLPDPARDAEEQPAPTIPWVKFLYKCIFSSFLVVLFFFFSIKSWLIEVQWVMEYKACTNSPGFCLGSLSGSCRMHCNREDMQGINLKLAYKQKNQLWNAGFDLYRHLCGDASWYNLRLVILSPKEGSKVVNIFKSLLYRGEVKPW